MKLARYLGGGRVVISDEPAPSCPLGGLLVKTEACGLCSGELMDWYMDQKVPHVFGHEVCGRVVESDDERFSVGQRVFAHHHAPCLRCSFCEQGLHVHCVQWKRTKLEPGGMAEYFAVSAENLNDTFAVDDLRAINAALIEPLACVVKSLRNVSVIATHQLEADATAVIGLGVMGLMHALLVPGCVAYDINPHRVAHGRTLGIDARLLTEQNAAGDHRQIADITFKTVFVCPGNKAALDLAIQFLNPGGTIVLFAPMPPGEETPVNLNKLYFLDAKIVNVYSCGPEDTRIAAELIRQGKIKAEQVVSDFIGIDDLPNAYSAMKRGDILKAMVIFE